TVAASFAIGAQTIAAWAGPHGAISPAGAVSVDCGADQTFTITADACYHITDVLVDGASVGPVGSYTFTHVTAGHTIAASFAVDMETITATTGDHGAISPAGPVDVDCGSNQAFTVTPDACHHLADLLRDGL